MTSYSPDKIFYNVKNLSGLIYFEDFYSPRLLLLVVPATPLADFETDLNEITSPLRSKINGSTIHDLSFLLIFIILLLLTL